MVSNLPQEQKENWALNEIVMPVDTNNWGHSINMLSKAMPIYASTGNFYTVVSFTDNVINLSPLSYIDGTENEAPLSYIDGMSICFKSTFNNTESCFVNVDTLGNKQIKRINNTVLESNDIQQNHYIILIYNQLNDCFYLVYSTNKLESTANQDLSNLTPEGETHFDNKYVQKSGDTMSGTLTINTNKSTLLEEVLSDYTSPSSQDTLKTLLKCKSSNNKALCLLEYYQEGETRGVELSVRNSKQDIGTLALKIDETGNTYATAPNPAEDSDTNNIATTSWVNSKIVQLENKIETWESEWFTSPGSSKSISFNLAGTGMNATNAPHIFIEMIGKVVEAVSNYNVGDIVYPQFTNYNGSTGDKEEGQSVYFSGNTLTYAQGNGNSWVGVGANGGHGTLRASHVQIKIILRRFSN